MAKFICDPVKIVERGKGIIGKYYFDERSFKEKDEKGKWFNDEFIKLFGKFDKIDLASVSDKGLLELYTEFDDFYEKWWGFTEVAELISEGAGAMLKESLSNDRMKYFDILVTPTSLSYHNQEQEKLFAIIKKIESNNYAIKLFEEKIEKIVNNLNNFPEIDKLLENHVSDYHWMQNNYYETSYLDKLYFIGIIKSYLEDKVDVSELSKESKSKSERTKQEKRKIIDELNLDDNMKKIVDLIDYFCSFQDYRKKLNLIAHYYYDGLCKEASNRVNIPYSIFRYATPYLLKESLRGNDVRNEIEKLTKKVIMIITDKDIKILTGDEAVKKEEELFGKKEDFHLEEIEGMCASIGVARGRVRKLFNTNEFHDMKEGEVLVTTMTSPDFLPVMKKASAIVTDEGGVTCHAAIVSRELGIPCVIGTKIATQVFNNGDKVEVNANHGVVKRIK